jgi:hypothetical protein
MSERNFRIRISRGDTEFEAEGDKAFVLEMLKRFEQAAPVVQAAPGKGVSSAAATREIPSNLMRSMSAAEFLRQFKFKQHTDIVLAFGYYIEHHKGLKEFTPADIGRLYYEAKIEPSNISMACIRNTQRGYLMEPKGAKKGAKKRYMLTSSGEEYIRKNTGTIQS